MALPPLDGREAQLYKDSATVYRKVLRGDGSGNVAGWTIAPISSTDATPMQNIPCNFHATWNFDTHLSAAGMTKQLNTETSDMITCQRQMGIKATDRMVVTTRWGIVENVTVQGDPAKEVLVPCTACYIVPTTDTMVIV